MFNLQGSEIIIILLLALVVLGPEKLPEAMRKAGKFYADIRKMSSGFQDEFRAAMDEPMKEVRETANMLRDSADFTALADGERDEKPQSDGGPASAEPPQDAGEIDDDEDDEVDVDPSVGAGEGLAPPGGESPVDITKPKAQAPPPPPPPFSGSTTLGPSVVDDTTSTKEPDSSIPTPPAPFSGSTTLGLGLADASDADADAEPIDTSPPEPSNGDTPAAPPAPSAEPQPGAEDAPA